jgi:hypothetical protein
MTSESTQGGQAADPCPTHASAATQNEGAGASGDTGGADQAQDKEEEAAAAVEVEEVHEGAVARRADGLVGTNSTCRC